jgi:SAM-dependent methyltransferase
MNQTSSNRSKWEFENRFYQKHLELYLDRMYHHLRSSGARRVLDAGCGEGYVYRAMKQRGYSGQWTGFDFSKEAIEYARRESPEVEWRQASAFEIPFADRSVDLVFSSEVLEHLDQPQRALSEFARVSNHWLLLSVPLEPWFRALTWLSVKLHLGGDPGHVNYWTPSSFRDFVSTEGHLVAFERTTVYQIALVDVTSAVHRSA